MNYWIYIAIIAAALAIYAMVDIWMKHFPIKRKMIWFPIVVLVPLIGPLAYYFFRRSIMEDVKEGA